MKPTTYWSLRTLVPKDSQSLEDFKSATSVKSYQSKPAVLHRQKGWSKTQRPKDFNSAWWWRRASCPRMSVDILGTNCDQCRRSMVQCCFTSTETVRVIRTKAQGRPHRLSHSSWTLTTVQQVSSLLYTTTSNGLQRLKDFNSTTSVKPFIYNNQQWFLSKWRKDFNSATSYKPFIYNCQQCRQRLKDLNRERK